MSESLDNLAIKYNTDKSSLIHNYAVKYDKILSPYRLTYKKILEVGVYLGGSLRMWKEYFTNAEIVGVDNCKDMVSQEEDRIKIVIGDQGESKDLLKLKKLGQFDLIVDDGSHLYEHQIKTFQLLFGALKSGGIYIIEDVCTSYWSDYGLGAAPITTIDYFKKLVDEVNFNGIRVDSLLDRRESLLIPEIESRGISYQGIESIHFLNSAIIIHKR